MGRHSLNEHNHSLVSRIASLGVLVGAATLVTSQTAVAAPDSVWDKVAECESSGQWNLNRGKYDGGLQFLPATWNAYGGREFAQFAYQASRSEQIKVAERVLAGQGWNAWPVCSRRAGVRSHGPTRDHGPAAVVQARSTPTSGASVHAHVVVAGDTLSKIAPQNWREIAKKNNIADPNLIFPGQVINL
jgi:resuscitation-promoting factor RpfA